MWVALHEHRVEPSLEEVAVGAMAEVEVVRVSTIQELHSGREIGMRRLDHQVVVIRHEQYPWHLQ